MVGVASNKSSNSDGGGTPISGSSTASGDEDEEERGGEWEGASAWDVGVVVVPPPRGEEREGREQKGREGREVEAEDAGSIASSSSLVGTLSPFPPVTSEEFPDDDKEATDTAGVAGGCGVFTEGANESDGREAFAEEGSTAEAECESGAKNALTSVTG